MFSRNPWNNKDEGTVLSGMFDGTYSADHPQVKFAMKSLLKKEAVKLAVYATGTVAIVVALKQINKMN